MTAESSNSGLDELMRLSQQFSRQEREATEREKENARQKQKSQDVLTELKAFSISMAVKQLELVASREITERVGALKKGQETAELRKLIKDLVYELERQTGKVASSNPDIKPLEQSARTLTILVGLLFSLSN